MYVANIKGRLATSIDGKLADVEQVSGGRFGSSPAAVYRRWIEFRAWGDNVGASGSPAEVPSGLGAPSPAPRQAFGIGLNYQDHVEESGLEVPDFPSTFCKFPSCIVGAEDPVEVVGNTSDWEVELVVVIGRAAHNAKADEGWDYVAGLTVGQDLSERTRQLAGSPPQFSLGKSFPGYGPTGPWLVTPDEVTDPADLPLRCFLDGEKVQESRTSQLIFSVPQLIEALSSIVTLLPGDLIFTGTPGGVGAARSPQRFLRPGQTLVSEIDGIGQLTTTLVGPS